MNIYFEESYKYYEDDLIVVPIYPFNKEKKWSGKSPNFKNWEKPETYTDWEKVVNRHKNFKQLGIGIITGKINNLIVVDIDSIDNKMKDKIYKILPPTPIMKVGNKNKGVNFFYRYNPKIDGKIIIGKGEVEI